MGSPMPPLAAHPTIKLLQAILQFFRGLHRHPPNSSGIPCRIPLEMIARHLLPNGLVLRRKPLLPDVHFPRLSTSRTSFHVCLLGLKSSSVPGIIGLPFPVSLRSASWVLSHSCRPLFSLALESWELSLLDFSPKPHPPKDSLPLSSVSFS